MDRVFPVDRQAHTLVEPESRAASSTIGPSGFLLGIGRDRLLAAAVRADALVIVGAMPGASLVSGNPFARAWDADGSRLAGPRFHELEKAVNDPTTAVHALGHVSAVLCAVARRTTGPETLIDDDGRPRVVLTLPTTVQLLDLVMDQVLTYAFSDPRTAERTIVMLREITTTAGRDHHRLGEALLQQAERCRAAIGTSGVDATIRARLISSVADLERDLVPTPTVIP